MAFFEIVIFSFFSGWVAFCQKKLMQNTARGCLFWDSNFIVLHPNWISTTSEIISTHCGTYSLSLWAVALLAIALQAEKKELSSSCFSALLSVKGSLIKFCAAAEKCYCFPRNMDCLLRLVIVKLSYFRYGNVFLVIWYQFLNLESTPEVVFL